MTPTRMREILCTFGLSLRQFADLLDTDGGTMRSWASGRNPIPAPVGIWLELLARFLTNHPPPRRPNGDQHG